MLNDVGTALAGLLAVAIILMGARYLLAPKPAAAGFGIPGTVTEPAWLAVKAVRDIAIGIAIALLLVTVGHRPLGYLMLATALIPIADGTIVIQAHGPKAIAYGVHWSTAALIVIVAVLLIV
ncbi:MAG TPA: DUF4267 domain-containing protein [Solirubrobacteraceae bacterium]|jgi:hypothetical protein